MAGISRVGAFRPGAVDAHERGGHVGAGRREAYTLSRCEHRGGRQPVEQRRTARAFGACPSTWPPGRRGRPRRRSPRAARRRQRHRVVPVAAHQHVDGAGDVPRRELDLRELGQRLRQQRALQRLGRRGLLLVPQRVLDRRRDPRRDLLGELEVVGLVVAFGTEQTEADHADRAVGTRQRRDHERLDLARGTNRSESSASRRACRAPRAAPARRAAASRSA